MKRCVFKKVGKEGIGKRKGEKRKQERPAVKKMSQIGALTKGLGMPLYRSKRKGNEKKGRERRDWTRPVKSVRDTDLERKGWTRRKRCLRRAEETLISIQEIREKNYSARLN